MGAVIQARESMRNEENITAENAHYLTIVSEIRYYRYE